MISKFPPYPRVLATRITLETDHQTIKSISGAIRSFLWVTLLAFLLIVDHGFAKPQEIATRYRGVTAGNNLTEQDLQDLGQWPINVLRYSLAWHETADSATEEEYFTWLDGELTRLDQLLTVADMAGYKVVVQLFTPPGGFVKDESGPALHSVFVKQWAQTAYLKAWEVIATRYARDTRIGAFHLLNEPAQKRVATGLLPWSKLAQKAINTVRTIDPSTPLIIDAVYGNPNKIGALSSIKGKNLIYGFNFYLPYGFVKQGLPGFKEAVKYPSPSTNKRVIESRLRSVFRFQRNKMAQLWVGEFSITRWTPTASAVRYLNDIISIFEKNRWNWTYHAYREADVWDLELGTKKGELNRTTTPSARLKTLLRAWRRNK
jgi:endoglucanase